MVQMRIEDLFWVQDRHGTAKMADFGLSCAAGKLDSLRPQQSMLPFTEDVAYDRGSM